MAQGGHGWPNGPFHHANAMPDNANISGGGIAYQSNAYGFQPYGEQQPPNQYAFNPDMGNAQGGGHVGHIGNDSYPGNDFAAHNNPHQNEQQQVFTNQSFYPPPNSYGDMGGRPQDDMSQQPPPMQQQQQQQLRQQQQQQQRQQQQQQPQQHDQQHQQIYRDAQFQRNPQYPSNVPQQNFEQYIPTSAHSQPTHGHTGQSHLHAYPQESWQNAPPQQAQPPQAQQQNNYGHQPMNYEAQPPQNMYQQPPVTVSTATTHNHVAQPQFAPVQGQPDSYQTPPNHINHTNGQVPQHYAYQYQMPAANGASTPPQQAPVNAQPQGQPGFSHAHAQFAPVRTASPAARSMARGGSRSNAGSPAQAASFAAVPKGHPPQMVHAAPASQDIDRSQMTASPQTNGHHNTPPTPQPFPPPGFVPFDGLPPLAVSANPISMSVPAEQVKAAGKRTLYTAKHNTNNSPLLPEWKHMLPCEILREWTGCTQQLETGALNDGAKQQISKHMDHLQKEMIAQAGKTVEKILEDGAKKRRGRPKKPKPASAPDESDSSAYSSDEEDEIEREAQQIKAAPVAPDNTEQRITQDVVKIVWYDPDEKSQENPTATAIQSFGSYVDVMWSKFKKDKDTIKVAKSRTKELQADMELQIKKIRWSVETANKFCDDRFSQNAGGNRKLVSILRNALQYTWASKDYNGPFSQAILLFLSRITTMESKFVIGVLKLDDLRQKYKQDLNQDALARLDEIFAHAKAFDKQSARADSPADVKKEALPPTKKLPAPTSKEPPVVASKVLPIKKEVPVKKTAEVKKLTPTNYSGLSAARKVSSGTTAKQSPLGSPSKRPRDEEVDSRVPKKVAVEGVAGAPSVASKASTPSINGASATAQPRPKSGSILPGKTRPVVKPPVKKVEAPSSGGGLSSIGGLLAEIAKPKEEVKPRGEAEAKAPETEEEKTRRLRKQARKQLRVRWKSDDQLTEVRIFQHDTAEDEGRASEMVKDARDSWSEGQMLKRGIQDEEEDDDGGKREAQVELRPWKSPSAIDFKLDSAQREKNFSTRGGTKAFHTEEQKSMEEYESRVLMAIYTNIAEIPETPRSPAPKDAVPATQPPTKIMLGDSKPMFQEVHRRWAECGQMGHTSALQRAIRRLGISTHSSGRDKHMRTANMSSRNSQPQPMTQEEREANVIAILQSKSIREWTSLDPRRAGPPKTQRRSDYEDEKLQQVADNLEMLAESFKDSSAGLTRPPQWMSSNEDRMMEWWTGYNDDLVAHAQKEAAKRAKELAEEQAARHEAAQQEAVRQAAQQAQAPTQSNNTAASSDTSAAQWAAYLAQFQQQQQPAQQPTQGQDPSITAILQQVQALQGGGHQQPQPAATPAPSAQSTTPDVNALLAALGQSSQPSQAPAANNAASQDPQAAWAAWYAAQYAGQDQSQASAYQQQQQQPDANAASANPQSDANNAAMWAAYYAQFGANANTQQQQTQSSNYEPQADDDRNHRQENRFRDRDRPARGGMRGKLDNKHINRALIGTKPCSFWAKGQCAKGDDCTFRHDPNDLK